MAATNKGSTKALMGVLATRVSNRALRLIEPGAAMIRREAFWALKIFFPKLKMVVGCVIMMLSFFSRRFLFQSLGSSLQALQKN